MTTNQCCSEFIAEDTATNTTYNFTTSGCTQVFTSQATFTRQESSPDLFLLSVNDQPIVNAFWFAQSVTRPIAGFIISNLLNTSYTVIGSTLVDSAENIYQSITVRMGGNNWTFTVDNTDTNTTLGQFCVSTGLGGPLPMNHVPPSCTSLQAETTASNDGQQICEIVYIVTIPRGPCPLCPESPEECSAVTQTSKSYRFYCPNVVPYLLGEGCTLVQKVTSLQKEGYAVTPKTVGEYITLRLILAQLAFGTFKVAYLQRKYYAPLVRKLSKSKYCHLLQQLDTYPNYQDLFV